MFFLKSSMFPSSLIKLTKLSSTVILNTMETCQNRTLNIPECIINWTFNLVTILAKLASLFKISFKHEHPSSWPTFWPLPFLFYNSIFYLPRLVKRPSHYYKDHHFYRDYNLIKCDKFSEICLNQTSLGPVFVLGIDRCSYYTC